MAATKEYRRLRAEADLVASEHAKLSSRGHDGAAHCNCEMAQDYRALADKADAARTAKREKCQDGWISVEDGMPSRSGEYLVVQAGDAEASTADYFLDEKWMTVRSFGQDSEERQLYNVTYWRELPAPPVPAQTKEKD